MNTLLCISLALLSVECLEAKALVGAKHLELFGAATVELPIYARDDDLYFNLSVGSPAQEVPISLYYFSTDHDLQIVKKANGGDYDETKSSTWVKQYVVYDSNSKQIGMKGMESFTFGAKKINNLNLILQDPPFAYTASIGFGSNTYTNSFWRTLLPQFPTQAVTVAFDTYPTSGAITVGGYDKKRCFADWKIVPESIWKNDANERRFGVTIDKIEAGKYSFNSPGKITLNLNNESTRWPKTVYYNLVKAVGSRDGRTVDCKTDVNISFKVEDIDIVLTPDEYLDREMQKQTGNCLLAGVTVDDSKEYSLPMRVFEKHCVSIDYEKGEIGFATRKSNS